MEGLAPAPSLTKGVLANTLNSKFEESDDFYASLDLLLRDKDVGFGLGELDAIEFKRHFKVESKRKLKGMKFADMEDMLRKIEEEKR